MSADQHNQQRQPIAVGERDSLSLPIELEEGPPPFLVRAATATVSGLMILLLVWSNIAQVRERSIAFGEIAPYGSTRKAAHLEGGIIEEVFIAPGDRVEEGAPLARLRVENAGGEYDRYAARRDNLLIQAERLAAQAEGRAPVFGGLEKTRPSLIAEQMAIYDAAEKQHKADIETLAAKEASAKSEVAAARAEQKAKNQIKNYAKEQLAIQEELIADGFTSKQAYLDAKTAYASAKAAAAAASARFEQAKRAFASATAERTSAEAAYRNRVAEERAKAVAELAELEQPLVSLEDRAERLTVRAPVAGVVKSVAVDGQGDVVRAGGVVAEITPTNDTLVAEVRVHPKDVGHVAIGQKTEITVTTFDPNRYGKIPGRITHLSVDTFLDERTGEHYYMAHVTLDNADAGRNAIANRLSAGMEVRADIITQSRSLMQYMLKPVERSLDRAFAER